MVFLLRGEGSPPREVSMCLFFSAHMNVIATHIFPRSSLHDELKDIDAMLVLFPVLVQ
jgi:hypothetical protein